MRFSRKVDNVINFKFLEQPVNQLPIVDAAMNEMIASITSRLCIVGSIAGIGQSIQINDLNVLIVCQFIINKMTADKAGPTSYQ